MRLYRCHIINMGEKYIDMEWKHEALKALWEDDELKVLHLTQTLNQKNSRAMKQAMPLRLTKTLAILPLGWYVCFGMGGVRKRLVVTLSLEMLKAAEMGVGSSSGLWI